MTDQMQTAREDLAFLRAMAAEGGRAAPQGGIIIAAGGFLFGAASVAAWAILSGRIAWGANLVWAPWLVATAAFYLLLFLALRGIKREGSRGVSGRLAGQAWSALGGAMFTIVAGYVIAAALARNAAMWNTLPTVFLALYGAGWLVAGVATGRAWPRAVGLLSFVAAVVIACLAGSVDVWLAYGAALVVVGGLPGLYAMRTAPEA